MTQIDKLKPDTLEDVKELARKHHTYESFFQDLERLASATWHGVRAERHGDTDAGQFVTGESVATQPVPAESDTPAQSDSSDDSEPQNDEAPAQATDSTGAPVSPAQ